MRPLSRRATSVGTLRPNRPPADVRSSLLWYGGEQPDGSYVTEAFGNPDWHGRPHRVYWGSHGCDRPSGHDGPCWCDCCDCDDHPDPDSGCVAGPPYYGPDYVTRFYGEDVAGWTPPSFEGEYELMPDEISTP